MITEQQQDEQQDNEKENTSLTSSSRTSWSGLLIKQARKLSHIIGTPTMQNFKSLLQMNVIKNSPVTVEDINIDEEIFGPDVSSLRGKSTRLKPTPVRKDIIQIPKELIVKHHDIELYMDNMYINECGMLTTIDWTIKFQSPAPMNSRHHKE
jgi:hypothetical protein